jgi:hypothetical protein
MGMFNTSALYNDPLLDTYSVAGSSVAAAAARGNGGKTQPVSGMKGIAPGAGRGSNFDTASLKSQDDTARYTNTSTMHNVLPISPSFSLIAPVVVTNTACLPASSVKRTAVWKTFTVSREV